MIRKILAVGLLSAAGVAQTSVALNPPLLPQAFAGWTKTGNPIVNPSYGLTLAGLNKAALEEGAPQRSQVENYLRVDGGVARTIHSEAIEFGDRSGAYSAFTLAERPGMKAGKDVGSADAVGEGAVLFTVGASVVLVNGAGEADLASLKGLAEGLPKVSGNKGVFPLLPSLAPAKGLVDGSLRYAEGAATYAAQGGVLPAAGLGWEKSAEAVTAKYDDKRGKETLTLLLYPTPAIAGQYAKKVQEEIGGMGASFGEARVRREAEVVMLAEGTFSGDEAQKMIENVHMKQQVSFDKDVQPVFHVEVQKTFTLLQSIFFFCAVFGGAAVVLGFFLGFGRAWVRTMMGKPAAVEVEFLSLHLDPQNKKVISD